MISDRESRRSQIVELFRNARPEARLTKIPHITIRGNYNLITVGAGAIVRAETRKRPDGAQSMPRSVRWPGQILEAIRAKAIENRISQNELCELAQGALGRAIVTIEKLNASELARVYEAVCTSEAAE